MECGPSSGTSQAFALQTVLKRGNGLCCCTRERKEKEAVTPLLLTDHTHLCPYESPACFCPPPPAVYLLLGLVCVLVVLETCCELPQMKRLSLRFQQEHVRELDSETTNIIGNEQLSEPVDRFVVQHPAVITSVLDQAASLRRDTAVPYVPAANGKLR